ncbi:MAG: protoglobin domain-containing protein, partial [Planctomycetales bacterium]
MTHSQNNVPPENQSSGGDSNGVMDDLAERLEFLSLTDEDAQRLRSLLPLFQSYGEPFAEDFYRHLFRFKQSARFLTDPQVVQRLKQLQLQHLQAMFQADWSDGFTDRLQRVGKIHAEIGLDPTLFLGAYAQYVQYCVRRFAEKHQLVDSEFVESVLALWKALLLDVSLTLEAYFEESTQDLRQALDMYWKANVELHHFAELASHDLKTPLATVINLCDEVIDEFRAEMPEEAVELIGKARDRTLRMSSMIDDLLAKTRPREILEDEAATSSEAALRDAIDRLQPVLDKNHIEARLPDRMPYVLGDSVRLREVFYNLLSNAAKFMDKPEGRIEVEADIQDDHCVFTIRDNGPGFPQEEQERVFAAFRRLAPHRDKPGSGLGLYFTKNLVEQQGGRVWVESVPG